MKPDKSQPQKFSVRKRLASFRFAFSGIKHALLHEHNFRLHLVATLISVAAGFYFDINKTDWLILVFAIGFVLIAELFNSAIELIADFISPGKHETIGKIKDISAGAVLIAVLISVIAGTMVFWPYVEQIVRK